MHLLDVTLHQGLDNSAEAQSEPGELVCGSCVSAGPRSHSTRRRPWPQQWDSCSLGSGGWWLSPTPHPCPGHMQPSTGPQCGACEGRALLSPAGKDTHPP